jgi:hypothetical protein
MSRKEKREKGNKEYIKLFGQVNRVKILFWSQTDKMNYLGSKMNFPLKSHIFYLFQNNKRGLQIFTLYQQYVACKDGPMAYRLEAHGGGLDLQKLLCAMGHAQ